MEHSGTSKRTPSFARCEIAGGTQVATLGFGSLDQRLPRGFFELRFLFPRLQTIVEDFAREHRRLQGAHRIRKKQVSLSHKSNLLCIAKKTLVWERS